MKRVLALLLNLSSAVGLAAVPTVTGITPAPGTVSELSPITITFSEAVSGVDASDLIMNGGGASMVSGGGDEYTFSFASVPLGLVTVTWAPNHDITDTEFPANAFDSTAAGEIRHYTVVDQRRPSLSIDLLSQVADCAACQKFRSPSPNSLPASGPKTLPPMALLPPLSRERAPAPISSPSVSSTMAQSPSRGLPTTPLQTSHPIR